MYYYILDPHNIPQKDFERSQTELQSLLTEFKISGEMARVTPLRVIPDLVETAINRGATTLVACGTDETFHQMLASIKGHEFTLAFIPFVPNTQLGKILGLNDLQTCVKTIASRRTEKIDVARINGSYFMSYLELGIAVHTGKSLGMFASMKLFAGSPVNVKMRIDDSYNINSRMMGALIVNTRGSQSNAEGIGNPQDGFLDLLILEKLSRFDAAKYKSVIEHGTYEKIASSTIIRCKQIEILEPGNLQIYIDGKEITKAPALIEIVPTALKMIVGKNRTF